MTSPSHPSPDEALIEELEKLWANKDSGLWSAQVEAKGRLLESVPRLLALARSASGLEAGLSICERHRDQLMRELADMQRELHAASEAKARLERLESALEFINDNYSGSIELRELCVLPDDVIAFATKLGWTGKAGA